LVTSDGVTANYGYAPEAQTLIEADLEFDQPEVTVERATAFVKFSWELAASVASVVTGQTCSVSCAS
jgi:hypothetical protein